MGAVAGECEIFCFYADDEDLCGMQVAPRQCRNATIGLAPTISRLERI